jgi:hypothetical protein
MKTSLLALLGLCALSSFGTLRAADQLPDPQSAYDRAVETYVDAAGAQLKAIRTEVDVSAKDASAEDDRKRFEPVYAKLDQSDELLADLRKARAADFDRIKSKFEQTRDDMLKALAAARGTS